MDGEFEHGVFREFGEFNSGAEEWAFYGWFKYTIPETMHNIPVTVLRAVMNDPAKNQLNMMSNFGDHMAALYIIPENLEFCTSSIDEEVTSQVNVRECITSGYGNDLDAWIFFYIGYSRLEKSWRVHLQYQDHNWDYVKNHVVHILPHWSGVYLGGDPFFTPFHGRIRNIEASFGPNSFNTGNLDYLIERSPPFEIRELMRNAFGDDLAFIMRESRAQANDYVYKLELPPNVLDDVVSVSYSFWFRLSTQVPEKYLDFSYLTAKNKPIMLGRVADCEISDFDGQQKERFLAVWIENGMIRFGAYDEANQQVKTADGELPFSEVEGSWNWVYIGLNLKDSRVVGAQYNLDN